MTLDTLIKSEAFHWGDNCVPYHDAAEAHMEGQWKSLVWPLLSKHPIDLTAVVDLAVGRGRNTQKLLEAGARHVTCVDVTADNLQFCRQRFAGKPVGFYLTTGSELAGIADHSQTLVYSWDAMVHFDLRLIGAYLDEIERVLAPGGLAFLHHSNYSKAPGQDFRLSPHWRNFMSADIFKHLAIKSGLAVVSQTLIAWGNPDLDCVSVLRKPYGLGGLGFDRCVFETGDIAP